MIRTRSKIVAGLVILALIVGILVFTYLYLFPKNADDYGGFELNTILIKANVPINGEFSSAVRISNNPYSSQNFKVSLNNLDGLASIDRDYLSLGGGESGEVKLTFKGQDTNENVHTGQLIVNGEYSEKKVPLIVNFFDRESFFAITQTLIPQYSNPKQGGKIGVTIKTFDTQDNTPKNVKMSYIIKDLSDEKIFIDQEDVIIQESLTLTKLIQLPSNIPEGDYVFITTLDYWDIQTSTAQLFSISDSKKQESFSGTSSNSSSFLMTNAFWIFMVVIVVFIFAVMGFLFYFVKTRDDLLIKLEKQQNLELRRNLGLVEIYKKNIEKLRNVKERKEKIKKIEQVKRKIVKRIKSEHKKQKKEIKELKKSGKKKSLKKKLCRNPRMLCNGKLLKERRR